MDTEEQFKSILVVVRAIPVGKVMSYGQVAQEAGVSPRTAGSALANAVDGDVPWQRVVGSDGYLRIGRRSSVLMQRQRALLENEGVSFLENNCVDMAKHQVGAEPEPQKTLFE